ncbi:MULTISPECIES: OmpH family outer membrane protein, partial [Burkholderiaceae]|uniref:OmpH family outer membrane protein n=1 Tax=Burkholderiaceae TaxID=119060 RepID=UPI0015FA0BDB
QPTRQNRRRGRFTLTKQPPRKPGRFKLARVQERAQQAIRQLAEQRGYDLVIQAVYVNPRIDITEDVMKALDASSK